MTKMIKNNAKLYITWLIMIALISIGVVTTRVFSVVALAVFAFYAMLSPVNNSCVLLFGILPFANIFKFQVESTSFFTMCELLVVLIAICKYKKIKTRFLLAAFMLSVYLIVSSIKEMNILIIVKVIAGFCFIYFFACNANKENVINLAYLLSVSTILMLLMSMNSEYYEYIEPYLLDLNYMVDASGYGRDTARLNGFLGDPNYCGVLIVMTVALLCVLYYYKKINTEFWAFIAFLVPLGFFTYSKSYFLCMVALALFLIVFVLFPKHRGWAVLALFVVAGVVLLALNGKIEAINIIIARFLSGDITTGRTALNQYYLNHLWNKPLVLLLGEGIAADRIAGAGNNVHSIYIESVFKLGAVGSALYIFALATSVRHRRLYGPKRKVANYIPMIFMAVLYSALAGITMYEFPFYLSIAFLARDFNLMDESA